MWEGDWGRGEGVLGEVFRLFFDALVGPLSSAHGRREKIRKSVMRRGEGISETKRWNKYGLLQKLVATNIVGTNKDNKQT